MKTPAQALVALLALALPASTQGLVVTAGPDPAPLGGPVQISFTNTSEFIAGLISCPWRILDEDLNEVFTPNCLPFEVLFSSLGVISQPWNQVDNAGDPVPPGQYLVEGFIEFGPSQLVPVTVGGVDANLTLMGLPNIGTADVGMGRRFWVNSPADRNQPYWLLASLGSRGVETCGGVVPLANDALLANTLSAASVIEGGFGMLDDSGGSDSSRLPLPDDPSLVGLTLTSAFIVLDLDGGCPVRTISAAYAITIEAGAMPFGG